MRYISKCTAVLPKYRGKKKEDWNEITTCNVAPRTRVTLRGLSFNGAKTRTWTTLLLTSTALKDTVVSPRDTPSTVCSVPVTPVTRVHSKYWTINQLKNNQIKWRLSILYRCRLSFYNLNRILNVINQFGDAFTFNVDNRRAQYGLQLDEGQHTGV